MADKETENGAEELPQNRLNLGKQQGLFGNSGIQLTEEELSSPATIKFLRHSSTQQEAEIQKLKSFEGQFFDKRQECEVLKKEKEGIQKELNSKKEMENIQKAMVIGGSLLLGLLRSMESFGWLGFSLALIAVLFIIGGLFPCLKIGASK